MTRARVRLLVALAAGGFLVTSARGSVPSVRDAEDFAAGVAAYESGEVVEAEAAFRAILERGTTTPNLLLNLGNAAFRQERWALAVHAYEWGLELDPGDEELRHNLALARSHVVADEVPTDLSPAAARLLAILATVPLAWTGGGFLACWTAAWLLFAAAIVRGRRLGTGPGLALLLVAVLLGAHAVHRFAARRGPPRGVIQTSVVEVKSGPDESSYATLFTLHAGTLLEVREERGDWLRVRVPHGPAGWLPRGDLAIFGRPETLPPLADDR